MTSGKETVGRYKSKMGEPASPKKFTVGASTVANNVRSMNTRGYFVQTDQEKNEARSNMDWDPLADVQGADAKGENAPGGQAGLTERSKNEVNAAPLKVYDYRVNADHLGSKKIRIRI